MVAHRTTNSDLLINLQEAVNMDLISGVTKTVVCGQLQLNLHVTKGEDGLTFQANISPVSNGVTGLPVQLPVFEAVPVPDADFPTLLDMTGKVEDWVGFEATDLLPSADRFAKAVRPAMRELWTGIR